MTALRVVVARMDRRLAWALTDGFHAHVLCGFQIPIIVINVACIEPNEEIRMLRFGVWAVDVLSQVVQKHGLVGCYLISLQTVRVESRLRFSKPYNVST